MKTRTIAGTYGMLSRPTDVFIYENGDGSRWYVAEDSIYVNLTYEEIEDGKNIDEIEDVDCFTWSSQIQSEEELAEAVEY